MVTATKPPHSTNQLPSQIEPSQVKSSHSTEQLPAATRLRQTIGHQRADAAQPCQTDACVAPQNKQAWPRVGRLPARACLLTIRSCQVKPSPAKSIQVKSRQEIAKTKKWEYQKWNMEIWRIRGVGRERDPLPLGGLFGSFGGFDVGSKHLHTKRHKTSADLRSAYEWFR